MKVVAFLSWFYCIKIACFELSSETPALQFWWDSKTNSKQLQCSDWEQTVILKKDVSFRTQIQLKDMQL